MRQHHRVSRCVTALLFFEKSAEQAGGIFLPLRKRIERRDPCVFRMEYIAGLVPDSLSGRDQRKCPRVKPFRELFCLLFLRRISAKAQCSEQLNCESQKSKGVQEIIKLSNMTRVLKQKKLLGLIPNTHHRNHPDHQSGQE